MAICELVVQFCQDLVGIFIPVLGFTPQSPEILPTFRFVEGEILVNRTPRAVQGACNPTVDRIRMSTRRRLAINSRTH